MQQNPPAGIEPWMVKLNDMWLTAYAVLLLRKMERHAILSCDVDLSSNQSPAAHLEKVMNSQE